MKCGKRLFAKDAAVGPAGFAKARPMNGELIAGGVVAFFIERVMANGAFRWQLYPPRNIEPCGKRQGKSEVRDASNLILRMPRWIIPE